MANYRPKHPEVIKQRRLKNFVAKNHEEPHVLGETKIETRQPALIPKPAPLEQKVNFD